MESEFPSDIWFLGPKTTAAVAHLSPQPKRHLDPFSRFYLAHYCDRPTDRSTDHATRSVTIGFIYVCSTAMRLKTLVDSHTSCRQAKLGLPCNYRVFKKLNHHFIRGHIVMHSRSDHLDLYDWALCESKKGYHPIHGYNFVNSWSICKILSLL